MGLLERIARLVRKFRNSQRPQLEVDEYRRCRFETMEGRRMLNADPIRIGVVYIEEDGGSDAHGDTFEVTFLGGAPNTQLNRLTISGDQNAPGLGVGDNIFDTKDTGLGADQAFPFKVISLQTKDPTATVTSTVEDGSLTLQLDFARFQAGDKLVFSIDVDEIEGFDPAEKDFSVINDGLDPITSGVEFQSSKLSASFKAPHYYDASGTVEFKNRYDDVLAGTGLNLPADDAGGKRDRSAGTAMKLDQLPLPVAISGTVYIEKDLDLVRDSGEVGLGNVELALWQKQGDAYVFTGHTTKTNANGDYEFGTNLGLNPGTYQVRETQPAGLFSVGAIPGTVNGQTSGATVAGNRDVLTDIHIPLGDQRSIRNDFAEAEPARISGFVYHDRDNDGRRDSGEEGLASVRIDVIPVDTIAPQNKVSIQSGANGAYEALNLAPGTYRIVEVAQPQGFFDGLDTAGTVNGVARGVAVNPGDSLENILLQGGQAGIEYNFGEHGPASLRGSVHLTDKDGNCFAPGVDARPIADVTIRLLDSQGRQVAETKTNSEGRYEFTGLKPGSYTLVEVTPAGLIDGEDHVGKVGGRSVGLLSGTDSIAEIVLGPDQHGTEYDFCEHEASQISGYVYHDANNNGIRETGETPIADVEIELRNAQGQKIGTTKTNASGFYEFRQLSAGTYTIIEKQPGGWLDGRDAAGKVDGVATGTAGNDELMGINLGWGQSGVEYNLGELLPGSIAGRVHADVDGDCELDPNEQALAGVTIQLLDANGKVIGSTQTNERGEYEFKNLTPGMYGIRELQPQGVFHGDQKAGSHGGNDSLDDLITAIPVGSGQTLVNYNFCEIPPSSLGGLVFADPNGDCVFNAGDTPLANVEVQLLNAAGNVVVTTRTNAEGRYLFEGLAPGTYSVREVQAEGMFHGGQTAGSHGGNDLVDDLISQIQVGAGQSLVDYNFCEVPPSSLSGLVFADPNGDCVFNSGDTPLANVEVQLLNAAGNVVVTTRTNTEGRYLFEGLAPGTYSVREIQAEGMFQGGQTAGSHGGNDLVDDVISQIQIRGGQSLVDYNFCEVPPSSLSGLVFVDPNGDCRFNQGDMPLASVLVQLYDGDGKLVGSTTTKADGSYKFEGLAPGLYTVRETQPDGYYQGGQTAGSHGGLVTQADVIAQIPITGGQTLVDYNFCELPPSSLSGTVFVDPNRDKIFNAGDTKLANVTVQLLNANGEVVANQLTNAEGRYTFSNLAPGKYSVRELQPNGYFDGGQRAGSGGGNASALNLISSVDLPAGVDLVNYDFTELPPATIAGFVFQDGPTILTPNGRTPTNLGEIRNGQLTPDDKRLPGVMMQLRNGLTGEAIDGSEALPGTYPSGPIQTFTDAQGRYEFKNLPGGRSYAVYQIHPNGYVDSIDTVGTTTGFAFNPQVQQGEVVVEPLAGQPAGDAIIRIAINPGQASENNNFSEVRVEPQILPPPPSDPPVIPPPPPPAPPRLTTPPISLPARVDPPPTYIAWSSPRLSLYHDVAGGSIGYSWHLSVVNGGMPRDSASALMTSSTEWLSTDFVERTQWKPDQLRDARWIIGVQPDASARANDQQLLFGIRGSTPIAGDFDGDGKSEVGVYYRGEWFIDLNGNGQWDEADLWAKLGDELDRPVIGDWDGDGKDDIGIHGPEWLGDRRQIARETGLPDSHNEGLIDPDHKPKNIPPKPEEATDGERLLQLKADGTRRADVIDHVFRFGAERDYPVSGDWNGDGIRTVGVFQEGKWRIDSNGDGIPAQRDGTMEFGESGDLPVVGDWDGNGIEEIGVYRQGRWILDVNGNGEIDAHDRVFQMGGASDRPIVGDWNGDGIDEPGIYREVAPPPEPKSRVY